MQLQSQCGHQEPLHVWQRGVRSGEVDQHRALAVCSIRSLGGWVAEEHTEKENSMGLQLSWRRIPCVASVPTAAVACVLEVLRGLHRPFKDLGFKL